MKRTDSQTAGAVSSDGNAVAGDPSNGAKVDIQKTDGDTSPRAEANAGAEAVKPTPAETVPDKPAGKTTDARPPSDSAAEALPEQAPDGREVAPAGEDTETVYRWHPAKDSGASESPKAADSANSGSIQSPKASESVEKGLAEKTPGEAQIDGSTTAELPMVTRPVLEPEYVKALTDIGTGHNDSNPVWSPSGAMIAFERSIGDKREIIVLRRDGTLVQKIYCRLSDGEEEMTFLFPGIVDDISYNAGIAWSPDEDRLVFMSNGGSGNYDLYLVPAIGNEQTLRLTEHPQKDSHPHWSPGEDRLVFVSGRTGIADVFIMDLAARKMSRLTNGGKTNLYPQWSPDGQKIALIYGSNENHDIHLIGDVRRPTETLKALTKWTYDDLRPVWSPDGTKIAFYSNYNPQNDPKIWSIIVIAADGSDPAEGAALAEKIVAKNVMPDVERGPAWMPDSRRIIFVKNDAHAYNPLYLVDIEDKTEIQIHTGTKMNHDVVCSADGTFAFRAQTEQWDHIYLAKLKE